MNYLTVRPRSVRRLTIMFLTIGIVCFLSAVLISYALLPIAPWYRTWSVDMSLACRQQYGASSSAARLGGSGPLGWRCTSSEGLEIGAVDVVRYCLHNHPGTGAKFLSAEDGNSWRCYK